MRYYFQYIFFSRKIFREKTRTNKPVTKPFDSIDKIKVFDYKLPLKHNDYRFGRKYVHFKHETTARNSKCQYVVLDKT